MCFIVENTFVLQIMQNFKFNIIIYCRMLEVPHAQVTLKKKVDMC